MTKQTANKKVMVIKQTPNKFLIMFHSYQVIQGIKVTYLFLQSCKYVYPIVRIPSPSPLKVQLNINGSNLPFTTEVQYNPNVTTMGNHLLLS